MLNPWNKDGKARSLNDTIALLNLPFHASIMALWMVEKVRGSFLLILVVSFGSTMKLKIVVLSDMSQQLCGWIARKLAISIQGP